MFDDCTTIEEIERRRKSLIAELHPDAGGSHERFLRMSQEYERAKIRLTSPQAEQEQPFAQQPVNEAPNVFTQAQSASMGPEQILAMMSTGVQYFGVIAGAFEAFTQHAEKIVAAKKKAAKAMKTKAAKTAVKKKKPTAPP